jgi:hypothetical protein
MVLTEFCVILVGQGNVIVSCLFWIPVTRPLLAHMLHHPVLGAGRSNLKYDHSMGEALGVPNSGLLVPPAAHISLDEPLESLLQHKRFRLSFLSFAESRIAGETVHFWDEVRELSKLSLTQQDRRVYMADHIIQKYIVNGMVSLTLDPFCYLDVVDPFFMPVFCVSYIKVSKKYESIVFVTFFSKSMILLVQCRLSVRDKHFCANEVGDFEHK